MLHLCFTATYCSDIRDPEALPAGNITYGATVQKECIQRNKETLILERLCGYDHYQNKYRTAGDSFICPGMEGTDIWAVSNDSIPGKHIRHFFSIEKLNSFIFHISP